MGCGRISTDRNTLVFTISKLKDIETILIPLFEQFPLNTTKYLDYLAFKKAFFMFINRDTNSLNRHDLYSSILQLKDTMNNSRITFDLPENHIRITDNYLVGLLEGDGTFYLNQNAMTVHVSLVTTTQNRIILEKIREFLLTLLDEHSCILGNTMNNNRLSTNSNPSIMDANTKSELDILIKSEPLISIFYIKRNRCLYHR